MPLLVLQPTRVVRGNGQVSVYYGTGMLNSLILFSVAYLPTNAALYYGINMNPAIALFFGWVSLLPSDISKLRIMIWYHSE